MQKADYWLRLMKQRTDALVAKDEKLQPFLIWVNEKSRSVKVPYKPAAVRAFYFAVAVARDIAVTQDLDLDGVRDLARALNLNLKLNLNHTHNFEIIVDLNLGRILARAVRIQVSAHALTHTFDHAFASYLDLDLYRPFAYIPPRALKSELRQALQKLMEQLPKGDGDKEILKQWWQVSGQAWTEQLRSVIIEHRNIGHDWQFNEQQKEVLKQYYDANKLLVDCLNRSCEVTCVVREEIEKTLLLPTEMLPNAEG